MAILEIYLIILTSVPPVDSNSIAAILTAISNTINVPLDQSCMFIILIPAHEAIWYLCYSL